MKKISIIAMLIAVSLPGFAQDTKETNIIAEEPVVETDSVAVTEPLAIQNTKTANPKTKFPHGTQIGLGVSATSGLNMFVGYNNKNFDSFWAKRFGVRLDFATTSPVKSMINRGVDNYMGDDGIEINDEISIIDGTIKAKHMGALVDFYPFGNTWFAGGLRITGGYVFGKLDIDADLKGTVDGLPSGTIEFEFDGTKYRYSGNEVYGTATANWKFHGPYVGTGFDIARLCHGLQFIQGRGIRVTRPGRGK